jgi:hypothetical protein
MSDSKLHSGDESLIRAAQTGEGLIELTPDLLDQIRETLDERTREFKDDLPKLVEACPYYMRLAVAAWVIEQTVKVATDGGSFRHFIYGLLEFETDAYVPLYMAGGMTITNEFIISEPLDADAKAPKKVLELVNALDKRLEEPAPNDRRSFLLDLGYRVAGLSKAFADEQEKRRRAEAELADLMSDCQTPKE